MNLNRMRTPLLILLLVLLVAACTQVTPMSTAIPTQPSDPTLTPEPTAAPTQPSDPTLIPEPTAVPTQPPDPTLIPEPTAVATQPPSTPPQVQVYNLGDATITQEQFPEDSRFRNMPVRLEGVIGVPGGEGQHPVVLILHGSHRICPTDDGRDNEAIWPCPVEDEQSNYAGFTYLIEALARAGYVALSINVNAEHTFAHGESPPTVRTIQLIDAHLNELAAANSGESDKFGVDLNGRVDLSHMVWVGHSRGGDLINWIVREQNLATEASQTGYGPVQGLILVAPSVFTTDALPTVDLPVGVILPACDADATLLEGQLYYESARFDPTRTNLVTSVYLEGANHKNFNTTLDPDRILEDRPDCAEDAALAPETQRDFLVQYTLDFLQGLYGDPTENGDLGQRLGLDAASPPPTTLYNVPVRVCTLYPPADHLTVMRPQSEAELSTNLLGGEVGMTEATAVFCPEGYYVPAMEPGTEPCKRVNFNQPGYPQQFVLSWESSGAQWRTILPEPVRDLTGYSSLHVRAALDPLSELNLEGDPLSFTVVLIDAGGGQAQAVVSDLPYPPGERQPDEYWEERFTGHVHMSTIIIPLTNFDVDLPQVAEIALRFDQAETGTLFLADLELVAAGR
jgi:hypothetical protein